MGPVCKKMQEQGESKNMLDDHGKYYVESHDLLDKKTSTRFLILIKNISNLDAGIYNCSVKNSFGEANFSFRILTKRNDFIFKNYFYAT